MAEAVAASTTRRPMLPERAKLHLAMVVCQFGYAGNHIILKAVINSGIDMLVFTIYRNITALVALVPLAYFSEKRARPPLNFAVLTWLFVIGFVGQTCNQGFYLLGLNDTLPTFASATENSVPAITFLMAAIVGQEQVHLNRKDGIAKVLGTVASVAGALVITLIKGPAIDVLSSRLSESYLLLPLVDTLGKNWTLGCIYLIGHCLCWSSWIVLQKPILMKYPAPLSVTSYTFFFSILQFLLIAAIFERDSQAWLVQSTGDLLSIFYAGLVASAMAYAIQIWVIDKAGPVFVSLYLPLQTLLVAVIEAVALGEEFYLGGIIGALLIVAGLYLVVWGKGEESKLGEENSAAPTVSTNNDEESSGNKSLVQPLIPTPTN